MSLIACGALEWPLSRESISLLSYFTVHPAYTTSIRRRALERIIYLVKGLVEKHPEILTFCAGVLKHRKVDGSLAEDPEEDLSEEDASAANESAH